MERTKASKELTLEQNKQNQTAFVITGEISKVEVGNKVSFNVKSQVAKEDIFGDGVRVADVTTAMFMEFPKSISHKILQNLNRREKITIELTDDEDFI